MVKQLLSHIGEFRISKIRRAKLALEHMCRYCMCVFGYITWSWSMNCPWWRHQVETFSALLAIFAENSPVPGEFPAQRPVARSFDVFFDLRLNKRLSKQWWGWWFETLSHPLWRHCNALCVSYIASTVLQIIVLNFLKWLFRFNRSS